MAWSALPTSAATRPGTADSDATRVVHGSREFWQLMSEAMDNRARYVVTVGRANSID